MSNNSEEPEHWIELAAAHEMAEAFGEAVVRKALALDERFSAVAPGVIYGALCDAFSALEVVLSREAGQ